MAPAVLDQTTDAPNTVKNMTNFAFVCSGSAVDLPLVFSFQTII